MDDTYQLDKIVKTILYNLTIVEILDFKTLFHFEKMEIAVISISSQLIQAVTFKFQNFIFKLLIGILVGRDKINS